MPPSARLQSDCLPQFRRMQEQSRRKSANSCAAGACSAINNNFRAVRAANIPPPPRAAARFPAITTRLPETESPDFTSACNPPAPITPGKVHPGNGKNLSRAPVARTSFANFNFNVRSHVSATSTSGASRATTFAPYINDTFARANRACHSDAWADGECSAPPRQICPPAAGLSSTTPTRAPDSLAAQAAAIPAGPAPITSTSNVESCPRAPSVVRPHNHAVDANNLATSRVCFAVNCHAALKTNSHSAKRRPRFSRHRPPKSRNSGRQYCRSHARSGGHNHIRAIHGNFHALSGVLIHGIFYPDHTARAVSPNLCPKFRPPIISQWPSTL